MLISEAAQYIKSTVPTRAVAALYGYTPNAHGFMVCPFHAGDREPSLKLYDSADQKGWYCFGCHAGGSVIDFVMRHDSCSCAMAVRAIDHHLNLHLLIVEDFQTQEQFHQRQIHIDEEAASRLKDLDDQKKAIEKERDQNFDSLLFLEHIPVSLRTARDWDQTLILRDALDYNEYQLSIIEEKRKKVQSWRISQRLRRDP